MWGFDYTLKRFEYQPTITTIEEFLSKENEEWRALFGNWVQDRKETMNEEYETHPRRLRIEYPNTAYLISMDSILMWSLLSTV